MHQTKDLTIFSNTHTVTIPDVSFNQAKFHSNKNMKLDYIKTCRNSKLFIQMFSCIM